MTAENRAEWACYACGLAAPVLLWGAGASWLWILLGGVLAVGVYVLVTQLCPGSNLAAVTRQVFGPVWGKAILWLQAAALIFGAGYLLRGTDHMVPNLSAGYPWLAIVLCILALAGCWHGRKAAYASGAVLFWLVAITVGVVLLFCLPMLQARWMVPEGAPRQILGGLMAFLLPVVGLYKDGAAGQRCSWLHLLLVFLGALVAFVTSACLSPRLAALETLPFFTLAAACRPLGYAARFDAIFCMTASVAIYCLLLVLLQFARILTEEKKRWPMVVFICGVLAASFAAAVIPVSLLEAYFVLFWVFFPICCSIFYCGKNREKGVDKGGKG